MNKAELMGELSKKTKLSKSKCERVIDELKGIVIDECKKGERVELRGFGTFMGKERKSRKCVNPQTKRVYYSKPKQVVLFKASKNLLK